MREHTPGPWKWWTSNSWRRLTAHTERGDVRGHDGGVLCPFVSRSDGHPDLIVSEADMALIAAAPDMLAALQMVQGLDIHHEFLRVVDAAVKKATSHG